MTEKDPFLEQRNQQICDLWLEGASYTELADKFGLQRQTIRLIIKAQGVTMKDRRQTPGRRALHERRPLSNLHRQIGNDISCARTTELDLSVEELAKTVGVSKQRMLEIEAGVYDPKLGELTKIAQIIKRPLEGLLKDRKCWASS